jgi:uncharacterized protein Yka (UPF0111/DUF47 family)
MGNRKDILMLIELMESSIKGKRPLADVSRFKNRKLAETYNSYFNKFINDNNTHTIGLNNAMNLIGNMENVMKMLETVGEQKVEVEKTANSVDELVTTVDVNSRAIREID